MKPYIQKLNILSKDELKFAFWEMLVVVKLCEIIWRKSLCVTSLKVQLQRWKCLLCRCRKLTKQRKREREKITFKILTQSWLTFN